MTDATNKTNTTDEADVTGTATATKKRFYIPEMTWPEVQAALPLVKMAIIPVGSNEQHGPHGTFQFDTACAREFSLRLGARLYPKALVAPAIPIGISGHHMRFPGTIPFRAETLVQILMETVSSLVQHGIKKFLFVNGHGGNSPALTIAANRIKQELGYEAMWGTLPYSAVGDLASQHTKSPVTGHSCENEVSILLALMPEAVRREALTPGKLQPRVLEELARPSDHVQLQRGSFFDETTENGALGDATQASAELGNLYVETALDRLVPRMRRFMED